MHREIEEFVIACQKEMTRRKWSYVELARATQGNLSKETCRLVILGDHTPRQFSIDQVGLALGIEQSIVVKAREFAYVSYGKKVKPAKDMGTKKPELDDVEAKLQKALNFFRLGAKELEGIDDLAKRTIDDITDRLRTMSTLKSNLEVFLKH